MGIKPISFAPEMVEALLDGRKTVTRRVIKAGESKPRWEEGDLLWVRERWLTGKHNNEKGWHDGLSDEFKRGLDVHAYYTRPETKPRDGYFGRVRLPRYMPRELSRIVLRATLVGLEHLHALSAAEAMREGMIDFGAQHAPIRYSMKPHDIEVSAADPIHAFQKYWNTLVDPKSGARWGDGPNVRVVEFEVLATTHAEAQRILAP